MHKIGFLFFCCLYLVISILSFAGSVDLSTQLSWAILLIALLGIPHGAIDHIIFLEDSQANAFQFYTFYFGLMGLYIIGWLFFPVWSLGLFLLLSAYHFGQSQFSELIKISKLPKIGLNLFWGISILSALIIYNLTEIIALSQGARELLQFLTIFESPALPYIWASSTLLTLALLLFAVWKQQISTERFFTELYFLGLIHFCFYALPLIIGFTLYFVILHSFKVLTEEFTFLKQRRKRFSVKRFIVLLLPFSLLSIFGTALLVSFSYFTNIEVSYTLLALILISILTLPHSIVMDGFYQKLFPSNV